MELLFNLLMELVLEGAIEGSKSNKIPKPARIFLIIILLLFYLGIIGIILLVGLLLIIDNHNIIGGILVGGLGLFILVACIVRFKRSYIEKKGK